MNRPGIEKTAVFRTSLAGFFLVAGAVSMFAESARADRIVLRNLKIISDKTVVGFDEDGVKLDDGVVIGWYDIEQAKVAAEKQAEFDRQLAELGPPLFRIRQRLRVGDYKDLSDHAEAVYPRYVGRRSSTAYMVTQATMWSRIAAGRREAAVEPYFYCFDYLRARSAAQVALPGDRRLKYDPATGICAALEPVWFDAEEAQAAMGPVFRAAGKLATRPDGVYIYYATLALTAGQAETADKALAAVKSRSGVVAELLAIAAAQREVLAKSPGNAVTRLRQQLDGISSQNRPLALYWLGLSQLQSESRETQRRGLLRLLRIPALYGEQSPELAAAALFHAMNILKQLDDARGSVALRNELLVRYGQTYFANRANAPRSDDPSQEAP